MGVDDNDRLMGMKLRVDEEEDDEDEEDGK